jgi:hypothetical protein
VFSGNITLSCAGAPSYSTCSVTPPSATLAAGSQTGITVTVATKSSVSAGVSIIHQPLSLAGAGLSSIFAAFFIFFCRRKPAAAHFSAVAIVFAGLLFTGPLACGGGGSSGSTAPTVFTTPPGTYTLQLSAVTGANVTVNQSLTLIVQ